jgi:hypothetical protein
MMALFACHGSIFPKEMSLLNNAYLLCVEDTEDLFPNIAMLLPDFLLASLDL